MLSALIAVTVGTAALVGLHWLRGSARRGGWAETRAGRSKVGFAFPLWAVGVVLLGLGRLVGAGGVQLSHTADLWLTGAGMLLMLAGTLAVLGVPMPRALLPRWLREREEHRP